MPVSGKKSVRIQKSTNVAEEAFFQATPVKAVVLLMYEFPAG